MYTSNRDENTSQPDAGPGNLYIRAANGSGTEEALLKSNLYKWSTDWSRDGRFILFYVPTDSPINVGMWVLPLEGDKKPMPFLQEGPMAHGQFSPDGRWVAYTAVESRRAEVFVRDFAHSEAKWKISVSGGFQPRWRGDGKELFYVARDEKFMAVEVKTASRFEFGVPKALFETRNLTGENSLPSQPMANAFWCSCRRESLRLQSLT